MRMSDLPQAERNLRRTRTDYVVIYALVDPRSKEIRYIGKTEKRIAQRLAGHIERPVNSGTRAWIAELRDLKMVPTIEPITCCGAQWWEGKEAFWIRWVRIRGGELLNRDPGGICRTKTGKLNFTGRVKNFIARKMGKAPFVFDFVKKRREEELARRKLQHVGDVGYWIRFRKSKAYAIKTRHPGAKSALELKQDIAHSALSIEPRIRRRRKK